MTAFRWPPRQPLENRPHAAEGLLSYRYRGRFGFVLIGARDHAEALQEAARSIPENPEMERLEVWSETAGAFVPCQVPAFTFGPGDGPGDSCAVEFDGFTLTARIEADSDMGPPWEEHDGHGAVSEWTTRPKLAGELVLCQDGFTGGRKRFYDFAGTVRTARAEGWGCSAPEGFTRRQIAAKAAAEDFDRLRAWCADEWGWCGVIVTASRADVNLGSASLWGIESDAGAYFNEVAAELTAEAMDAAREKLAELLDQSDRADAAQA